MHKRSHTLLASALLNSVQGFEARRYEWAFLIGSFQPDCNPLTYIKGSLRAETLRGHNYTNSRPFVHRHIRHLMGKRRWNLWNYYTLGKLTHYVADAFTFPHNDHYTDSLASHHLYERDLRQELVNYLQQYHITAEDVPDLADLNWSLVRLHRQYAGSSSDLGRDVIYIVKATRLLMCCCPAVS